MKKVVGNMLYDTDKAIVLADYSNHLGCTDLGYECEVLYVTKKGNFFLHGEGGPYSQYGEGNGRMRWGGEQITPLNKEEVFEWLQEHNEVEVIEELFPEKVEEA